MWTYIIIMIIIIIKVAGDDPRDSDQVYAEAVQRQTLVGPGTTPGM